MNTVFESNKLNIQPACDADGFPANLVPYTWGRIIPIKIMAFTFVFWTLDRKTTHFCLWLAKSRKCFWYNDRSMAHFP